ncbi:6-pyruvoyl trahydropterin synthase family protein [Mariniblastus fucicola]|uniref:6-carboxy-5,6,7,8-tetrahydropterin synthase n=1 Tax=Mariniblastus fucicola TaxID=980251 RepID=A0A5B9PFX9_9BACT|nr:6-carboxytetrahydropterin synthase [Mariniblastus fucicola]QEG24105.1 6-pyruvoyl tetrahydropterin synthase [Mariniblastus fucicola]
MVRLSREIRFALVSPEELDQQTSDRDQKNSWAAWPNTCRIAPQLRLRAVVEGEPDEMTGYLCNVKLIDEALRRFVNQQLIPSLADCLLSQLPNAESVLQQALQFLENQSLDGATLISVSLSLSPFLSFNIDSGAPDMIQLTHQFEFSAAHRLHCDSMSAEENVATFGKCNNPAGHGHNYVVEVSVSRDVSKSGGGPTVVGAVELAGIVNRNVIDVLDHKHLNEDIAYFSDVNPSVENISAAIFGWLKSDIESAGCQLAEVKVFETPKTWASFRG